MSVTDTVVSQLREAILSHTFAPGTRLNQSELAERLGVSRIPVRDALRELATEGLVVLAGRSGAVVTSLSIDDLQELYELRGVVEPLASRLAIPDVGRVHLMRMHECYRRMEEAHDRKTWLAANADFHAQVYRQSGRRRMITLIDTLRTQTDRYTWVHLDHLDAPSIIQQQHRRILDAADNHDAEAMEHATREHLVTSHEMIIQHLLEREYSGPRGDPDMSSLS